MASRPAAGGGVWVEVGPDRFVRWCDGFAQRHGGALAEPPRLVAQDDVCSGQAVELTAADGSTATCCVPFPPLAAAASNTDTSNGAASNATAPNATAWNIGAPVTLIEELAAHALVPRTIGVLLVRRGGYAVGIFEGPRLTDSKVGARHVQGRTKAGGWSQQRFARRREGQAREAYTAAADTAARILLPHTARLDALVVGGDAGALSALRSDPRLKALWTKEIGPMLNVGDPKMADLQKAPDHFRAVRIRLVERS